MLCFSVLQPAHAQTLTIGAYSVLGDMRYPVPNSTWGSWIRDTSAWGGAAGSVPTGRWEQICELGVDLPHFMLMPQHVTDDSSNIAQKLCKAAHHRGLRLMLTDPFIRNLGEGERRLLHPETLLDFPGRTAGLPVLSLGASKESWDCDRHLRSESNDNTLLLLPSRDAGARLVNRGCGGVLVEAPQGSATGRYVVSIRLAVQRIAAIDLEKEVLSVLLCAGKDSLRFTLHGWRIEQAFASAQRGVVEIQLGRVHFRSSGDGILSDVQVWQAATVLNARTHITRRPDLVLEYHGVLPLSVEAICFSDERAFALFNPELAAAEHAGLLQHIRKRLTLLGADSTARWPSLTYLEMAESLPEDASWPLLRRIAAELKTVAGTTRDAVQLYIFTSGEATLDSNRILASAAMMQGMASGFYVYPFHEAHCATPQDSWYYDSTYSPVHSDLGGKNTWTNHKSLSAWYRMYALQRRKLGDIEWMPAIQNHSWQFRKGWPTIPLSDTTWLREPSASELRFNCNLALAYGARGLMFYQFSSFPGLADTAVVNSRGSTWYGDMGCIGFLDPHNNLPRRLDTNGESKWDSTRKSIAEELRPAGDILARLRWLRGASWESALGSGSMPGIVSISAFPFGAGDADKGDRTLVEISEFEDTSDSILTMMFILNKRVDSHGGRRIILKLDNTDYNFGLIPVELFPGGRLVGSDATAGSITVDLPPASAVLLSLRKR